MEEIKFKSAYRSLDAKGRLMLPVDYREALAAGSESGGFVLTLIYGKLVAYMPSQWEVLRSKLGEIKSPSMKLGNFITKTLGLAEELIPDAQGRVRISQPLMRAGKLTKDIVLVGLSGKFEIWDQATFEGLITEDVSDELAAHDVFF